MTKSENHGIIIILLLLLCKKNSQYLYVIIEEHQKRIFHSLSLLKNVDGKSSYFSCYVLLYMTFIPLLFYTIFVFFFFFIYLYLKIFLCNNEKIYLFLWKKEEERSNLWMDGWISSTTPEFAATIKAEKKSDVIYYCLFYPFRIFNCYKIIN